MCELRFINSKKVNYGVFYVPKIKVKNIFLSELNQIGHDKIAFVLLPVLKPTKKNQFGFLRDNLFCDSIIPPQQQTIFWSSFSEASEEPTEKEQATT